MDLDKHRYFCFMFNPCVTPSVKKSWKTPGNTQINDIFVCEDSICHHTFSWPNPTTLKILLYATDVGKVQGDFFLRSWGKQTHSNRSRFIYDQSTWIFAWWCAARRFWNCWDTRILWIVPPPSNSGKWRLIGIPYQKISKDPGGDWNPGQTTRRILQVLLSQNDLRKRQSTLTTVRKLWSWECLFKSGAVYNTIWINMVHHLNT